MSIQDTYFYEAFSDSYLIGGHSYQCVCVLHAILLPSGYLTLSTIAPYNVTGLGLVEFKLINVYNEKRQREEIGIGQYIVKRSLERMNI
jgi:hypothetical protein